MGLIGTSGVIALQFQMRYQALIHSSLNLVDFHLTFPIAVITGFYVKLYLTVVFHLIN